MPHKVLLAFLGAMSFWLTSTGFCQQEVKIGYVSLKKVSDESLKKKAFEEEIKELLRENKAPRDAIRKEIAEFETALALSGPEQAKKTEQEILQKKRMLASFDSKLRREIEKRQLGFEKELLQDIAAAAKEVAEEKGYTWILFDEVLLYRDESADLTFWILVKMNAKYINSRSETESKPEPEASSGGEEPPVSAGKEAEKKERM